MSEITHLLDAVAAGDDVLELDDALDRLIEL
jgi:hypothetical protein